MVELPMIGAAGPFVIEDLEITMKDIFGEIQLEEQHPDMIFPTVEREEAELGVTIDEGVAPN